MELRYAQRKYPIDPESKTAILEMGYPRLLMIHSQQVLTKEVPPPIATEKSLPAPTMVPLLVLKKVILEKDLPNYIEGS
jgi:hypothetical protein